jgi:oxygen-dependent protoporphyrinogen oxidase
MTPTHDVVIVGGGLSGLGIAQFLLKKLPKADVVILERGVRPGGAIRTFSEQGFQAEWGPHGFLDNMEASRQLLADTGLDREVQKAPLADFVRYICLGGTLALIPQNPKKILASSLLPLTQKIRVLADLWKAPRMEEQTVSQWIEYRFGKGLLPFADAVFTGTYAGDIERLSIDGVMPGVRNLEKEAGSVLKGLIGKMRRARRDKKSTTPRHLPSMISFAQGMTRLPERLAEGKNCINNTTVEHISRRDDIWEIFTPGKKFYAKTLVLALPVNRSLALLRASHLPTAKEIPAVDIPEAALATVVMGFTDAARIPFGFGYLAPEQEKRFALGALFSTHMFPGRAPTGHVMLEALVGGRRHPDNLTLDDETMIHRCYEDIRQLMELPEPPCFSRVLRIQQGIPQLELGYPKLLAWHHEMEKETAGLHICGFGWGGVGINDMIKSAQQVAETIAEGGNSDRHAALKNVYF